MEVFDNKDEILVRYLLNELPKEENEEIEDTMVLDPVFLERAQVVETNLIERYLLDELSAAEKARFEKGFLIFPENRDKIEDARAFYEALHTRRRERQGPSPSIPDFARLRWTAFLLRMPAPAKAFTALVLIAAVAAVILLIVGFGSDEIATDNHNGPENARQVVSHPNVNSNDNASQNKPEGGANVPANKGTNESLPSDQHVAKLNAAPPGRVVVSIAENNGRIGAAVRGPGDEVKVQSVRIPAGVKSFTMRVSLEPNEYFKDNRDCSVDISSIKFARLYPAANYQKVEAKPVAGKFQVSLNIPTAYLKDGGVYYFRVVEINSLTPFRVQFTK